MQFQYIIGLSLTSSCDNTIIKSTTLRKHLRLLAAMSLLLLSCSGFAQDSKKNHSLLWEITGPGVTKPSYLYGTMHVSSKMAFNFQDTFYVALKGVDVVALEINLDSFLINMIRSTSQADLNLAYNVFSGQSDFYSKMTELKYLDIDFFKGELSPNDNLLNQLLYRQDTRDQEYEEQTYLDLFIFQAAKKLRKQVANLEAFEKMQEYSYKAMMPDDDEKEDDYYDGYGDGNRLSYQLETAYRTADLDLIDSITRTESASRNFYHYFIVMRNRMMTETIDSIMKSGLSIFAACGAAHLPGDSGIIEMLREFGYTLRPVKAATTSKSHKSREQLEQMIAPQKMSAYAPADSLFTVSVPGKMQWIPSYSEAKRYVYPDMANGSFYQVSHLNTYGHLSQRGRDFYCKQIDSILYEVTPGDIQKKEFLPSVGSYAMYDVTSRVSVDNYIRYRIYIGDFDVFIFKLVGIKEYVLSKFGNTFFNSITLKERQGTAYKQLSVPQSGFSIEMPENACMEDFISPEYSYNRTGNINAKVQSFDPALNRYFLVVAGSMFDFSYIEEDAFELSYLAESLVKDRPYRKLSEQEHPVNGLPGRDFSYIDSSGNYLFIRTLTNGPNYYVLLTAQPDSTYPERYFNSFSLQQHTYTEPFLPYTDEQMHYKVNTTSYLGKRNASLTERYTRLLKEARRTKYSNDDYNDPWNNDVVVKICSGQSAECAQVRLEFESLYISFDGIEDYWNRTKKILTKYEGLILLSERYDSLANNVFAADLTLGDTNSTKTIRIKMLLKGSALYTLRAVGQQKELFGAWTQQLFETFAPGDTLMGVLPFGSKTALFMEHLTGADTVLNAQAMKKASWLSPDSLLTARLSEYIKTDAFKKHKVEERCDLIGLLADTANMEPLKMLEQLYMDAGDTVEIKFVVLEVLAAKRTESSLKMLCALILEDTPLEISEYTLDDLFFGLDSIKYPNILFPELLMLSRYQEYRKPIYSLLAKLLREKIVSPAIYKAQMKEILTDAREEYKRTYADASDYLNEDEDNNSRYNYYSYGEENENPYIDLLLPYDTAASVKKYFTKVMESKVDKFIYPLLLAQISSGRQYIDSLPRLYASSNHWRNQFYSDLVKLGHKEVFDTTYLHQECFARAAAFPEEKPYDEIVFIERRRLEDNDSSVYVYFFKCKNADDDNWRLRYSGYQPADGISVCATPESNSRRGEKIENVAEIDKMISSILKELRMERRKRVLENMDDLFGWDFDY